MKSTLLTLLGFGLGANAIGTGLLVTSKEVCPRFGDELNCWGDRQITESDAWHPIYPDGSDATQETKGLVPGDFPADVMNIPHILATDVLGPDGDPVLSFQEGEAIAANIFSKGGTVKITARFKITAQVGPDGIEFGAGGCIKLCGRGKRPALGVFFRVGTAIGEDPTDFFPARPRNHNRVFPIFNRWHVLTLYIDLDNQDARLVFDGVTVLEVDWNEAEELTEIQVLNPAMVGDVIEDQVERELRRLSRRQFLLSEIRGENDSQQAAENELEGKCPEPIVRRNCGTWCPPEPAKMDLRCDENYLTIKGDDIGGILP